MSTTTTTEPVTTEAFAERLFGAILGAQEVQALYLGERLGWYRALAAAAENGLTSVQLAEQTGTAERYAREWLEQQAACGYVAVDHVDAGPTERRFTLPAPQAEVLLDADSLAYVGPLARFVAGYGRHLDRLVEVYRSGGGFSWKEAGTDAREAQALANRPFLLHQLPNELLPEIPEVHARLTAGARVADIGCGGGWSAIGIAKAYPKVTVHGFDVDEPSIELARRNAEAAGAADRTRFEAVDATTLVGTYDLVVAVECVHDMSDPVGALAAMRRLAGHDGVVLVIDERTEEHFTAPAGEVERLLYGYSVMCCLPDGMATQPTAATGTVMRPTTLAEYARRAGYSGIDILPVATDFFRFYRLRP